jgi:O-methyltransferase
MKLLRLLPSALRRQQITKIVQPFTLVGRERIHNLYNLSRRIEYEGVPGDVVECGVCNGGTAAVLGHFATRSDRNRTLWLFDSFEGMPQTTEEDGEAAIKHIGKEVGDVHKVEDVLKRVDVDMQRVRIVKGWFNKTFSTATISKIALLNIDADWYTSVRLCLDTFYDSVALGGIISFDDYGHWPGCRQAVDEFFRERGLPYKLQEVDYTARWFQKI